VSRSGRAAVGDTTELIGPAVDASRYDLGVTDMVAHAQVVAEALLADGPRRWVHVTRVAAALEAASTSDHVVAAGWLHDIGYAESLARTGLHALDGALYLADHGWARPVVSLVAYHTGAEYEAAERGLATKLKEFHRPPQDELDLLIWADLTSSPAGESVSVDSRLAEILNRYAPGDPVHEAISRSADYLRACAVRAERSADIGRSLTQPVLDA
jgi:hypothetical protein